MRAQARDRGLHAHWAYKGQLGLDLIGWKERIWELRGKNGGWWGSCLEQLLLQARNAGCDGDLGWVSRGFGFYGLFRTVQLMRFLVLLLHLCCLRSFQILIWIYFRCLVLDLFVLGNISF